MHNTEIRGLTLKHGESVPVTGIVRGGRVWLSFVLGALVLLASLAHVPSSLSVLNYFDPPKLAVWAGLLLFMVLMMLRSKVSLDVLVAAALALVLWMTGRTLLNTRAMVDYDALCVWILPLLLFLAAACSIKKGQVRVICGFLVVAGVIQMLILVLQRAGLDPLFGATTSVMSYKPARMIGTIGYQNQAIDFLGVAAAGAIVLFRSQFARWLSVAALLVCAGLAGYRGGVVAAVFAAGILMVVAIRGKSQWSTRAKFGAIAAGAGASLIVLVFVFMLSPEFRSRCQDMVLKSFDTPATRSRLYMAKAAMGMISEKPLTGWGAGEYAYQYLDRLGSVIPSAKGHEVLQGVVFAREAHNDYLQFVAEFGAIGLALLAILWWTGLMRVVRGIGLHDPFGRGALFLTSYMMVSSLASFPWQTSMAGPSAGLMLGCLLAMRREQDSACAAPVNRLVDRYYPLLIKGGSLCLALPVAGWTFLGLYLDVALPGHIASGDTVAIERRIPGAACRYQALVGAHYATQGDYENAERMLLSAEQGYRDVLVWNNLGLVSSRLGKTEQAHGYYQRWERSGLDHSNALNNLSIVLEQSGRFTEAQEKLCRRMELWPSLSFDDIKRLVVLLLRSGDPDRAMAMISKYRPLWLRADIRTLAELENLEGAVCVTLGHKARAASLFRSALAKDPSLSSAKANLDKITD